ncbi:MAG: benzoate/H(+) symporter BenE family transporter [Gemmatimonadaceae bacterium]|nr:benzoate/H(+) symporter BenE family transporter [Gemmatimonadaceae bacterium]
MPPKLPPLQSWSSAFIAVLIGFGGTIALVVQAMRALGASVEHIGSGVTALCLGIAIGGAALSYRLRMPVLLAWSTPGAALLVATSPGVTWNVAVAVFIAASLMTIAVGAVPMFGRLAERIPSSIASAMLAGVLLPFCLSLFRLGSTDWAMLVVLVAVFIVARQRWPLHALLLALGAGVILALTRGDVSSVPSGPTFGTLTAVVPSFDVQAILSLAIPLFLVTLVSQNLPGLVVLRASGYQPNSGTLLIGSGVAGVAAAPFGAHIVNLAALTAAICTSDDAHPDRNQRWKVGVLYAAFYLLLAIFSPALVRLFLALPSPVIVGLTGVALIPALINALDAMLVVKEDRDAAIVTFLATGSGLALFGLGAAFWGLLVGFVAIGAKMLMKRSA